MAVLHCHGLSPPHTVFATPQMPNFAQFQDIPFGGSIARACERLNMLLACEHLDRITHDGHTLVSRSIVSAMTDAAEICFSLARERLSPSMSSLIWQVNLQPLLMKSCSAVRALIAGDRQMLQTFVSRSHASGSLLRCLHAYGKRICIRCP